jgi:outer membrane cobalamin receptor
VKHRPANVAARADRLVRTISPIPKYVLLLTMVLPTSLALPSSVRGQSKNDDLANKSLKDLMNIDVTSVSKKAHPLSRASAAIFVVTQADIEQSGATNIPDLLRMVPGLDVAQIDARF